MNWSLVRLADKDGPSLHAELLDGENYNVQHSIILSRNDNDIMEKSKQPIPLIAEDTTPTPPIARITKLIDNCTSQLDNEKDCIKFILSVDRHDTSEKIITFRHLLDYLSNKDENNHVVWKFQRIALCHIKALFFQVTQK